jgi:hypothetical protein
MGRNPSAVPSSSKFLAFHLGLDNIEGHDIMARRFHKT